MPTDADGRVQAFLEKTENPPTDQINAGCYVFRRQRHRRHPGRAAVVSVERETFPGLLAARRAGVRATSTPPTGSTSARPAAFVRGSADLVRGLAPTGALPGPPAEKLVLAGCTVADDAVISGGSALGRGRPVGPARRWTIRSSSTGRDRSRGQRANSVIGHGATVGRGPSIVDAVIGDGAVIGAGCELLAGVRVWPGVIIPDGGVRFSAPS